MSNELQRADKGVIGVLKTLAMSNTERINSLNRGITEYHPCTFDAFFEPSKGVYNSVVSGGNPKLRVDAMVAQSICAVQNGFPVIVLHEGNRLLEQQLKNNFSSSGKYIEISSRNPCFEPFYGLDEDEISEQILETIPKKYDIKVSVSQYIKGISEVLSKNKKHLSFKMFSTCPHGLIFDKVDELRMRGVITDLEEREIKTKLMIGQSENYKLDAFLASLKKEIKSIMYVAKSGYKPVSIISAIQMNSVLCFDITSTTNRLLLNTIISQFKLALTKELHYTIVIDSVPFGSSEIFGEFLKISSDKICKMFVSDDFYTTVGSDEKAFSTIIGESEIIIVMGHTTDLSAKKWSDVFGQYDKYEETYSKAKGGSKRTPFSWFSCPNYQNSISISKTREYIIKPEKITKMSDGEAYVLNAACGEYAHLVFNG